MLMSLVHTKSFVNNQRILVRTTSTMLEYDARVEALQCDVEYMKAVREQTEKKGCIIDLIRIVNPGRDYLFSGCGTINGTFCTFCCELNHFWVVDDIYHTAFDVCFGSSDRNVA